MKNTPKHPETGRIPGGAEHLLRGGLDRVVTRDDGVASVRSGTLSRRAEPPHARVATRCQWFCTDWFMPVGQERRAGVGEEAGGSTVE